MEGGPKRPQGTKNRFNYLRTKEALGYIVKLEKTSEINVMHISIKIQSNKYSPDHLEFKINEFLSLNKGGFTE